MQLETIIPLFPLGLVLLPLMPLPLHIFEERYKLMTGKCLAEDKEFGIVYFNGSEIQTTGCTARILRVLKHYDDGRLDILTRGQSRFVINDMYDQKPYLEGRVSFFDDEPEENNDGCRELADKGINLLKEFAPFASLQDDYGFVSKLDFEAISFLIAGCEGFSYDEKQKFLEMSSTYERLKKSVQSLERIIDRTKITSEIRKIIGGNGNMARFSTNLSDIIEK